MRPSTMCSWNTHYAVSNEDHGHHSVSNLKKHGQDTRVQSSTERTRRVQDRQSECDAAEDRWFRRSTPLGTTSSRALRTVSLPSVERQGSAPEWPSPVPQPDATECLERGQSLLPPSFLSWA